MPFTLGLPWSHNWMHIYAAHCFLNFTESGQVHYRPRFYMGIIRYLPFTSCLGWRDVIQTPSEVKEGGGSLSVFLLPFQFFSYAPVGGRESREETGCDILIFYLKLFSQEAVGKLADISGSACTKKDVRGLVSVLNTFRWCMTRLNRNWRPSIMSRAISIIRKPFEHLTALEA